MNNKKNEEYHEDNIEDNDNIEDDEDGYQM
jgi:hypothetical protein